MMVDETADSRPTHIDIGGMALPRDELAQVLPDIERFEAHLTDAIAVDSYMKQGDGHIPDYVRQWSQERVAAVIATLNEIGSLREQLTEQMNRRGAESQAESEAPDHTARRTPDISPDISDTSSIKGNGYEH